MPTLLETIQKHRETGAKSDEPYVLEIDPVEWYVWLSAPAEDGMADELCPWVQHGPVSAKQWRHRVSGQIYKWGEPFRLPGDDAVTSGFAPEPEAAKPITEHTNVRRSIPI